MDIPPAILILFCRNYKGEFSGSIFITVILAGFEGKKPREKISSCDIYFSLRIIRLGKSQGDEAAHSSASFFIHVCIGRNCQLLKNFQERQDYLHCTGNSAVGFAGSSA